MNKCVEPNCNEVPPNPAVPACDKHLCKTCLMGVIMGSDPASLEIGLCGACIDRDAILKSIHSLYNLVDERLGKG